ncbi:MAG: hypothetical protein JSW51_14870, partial [Gemmatimonadota bacterium]
GAVAVGADGLLIEVHCSPQEALSDGAQTIHPSRFDEMMQELRLVARAVGRHIHDPTVSAVGGARLNVS